MGMLIHRRKATEVKKSKTTKLADVTPVEKKAKKSEEDTEKLEEGTEKSEE